MNKKKRLGMGPSSGGQPGTCTPPSRRGYCGKLTARGRAWYKYGEAMVSLDGERDQRAGGAEWASSRVEVYFCILSILLMVVVECGRGRWAAHGSIDDGWMLLLDFQKQKPSMIDLPASLSHNQPGRLLKKPLTLLSVTAKKQRLGEPVGKCRWYRYVCY
jgi:hypothetical protein